MRQEDPAIPRSYAQPAKVREKASRQEISIELTRKSIHLLIALVPLLFSLSRALTLLLLSGGIIGYSIFETLRMKGYSFPVIPLPHPSLGRQAYLGIGESGYH